MRRHLHLILFGWLLLLSACSTTKFVPQDKYLLRKMRVKVELPQDAQPAKEEKSQQAQPAKEENSQQAQSAKVKNSQQAQPAAQQADKAVKHADKGDYTAEALADKMANYVRQKPNSEIFGFWPLQLQVYSSAGRDTTKWINRQMMKMGEAPEIFDPELADASVLEIKKAMFNKGYFNALVDTTMRFKKRKLYLTYHITAREPYRIRSYTVRLDQPVLRQIAQNEKTTLVSEGMQFDSEVLDEERNRIALAMKALGYYYFNKDYLHYEADSANNTHEVVLSLRLQDYVANAPDSVRERLFTRFVIRNVHFYSDYDPSLRPDGINVTTIEKDGYTFSYCGKKLIREGVLRRICPIRPGSYYSALRVERAYSELNALAPVKFVDISFVAVASDSLDCRIVFSRSKLNSVSAEIEGTYSAGDWGIAAGAGYSNRNLFRGAEEFNINGAFAYEWRRLGGRAIEAKAEASIRFPNAPKVSVGYKFQNRPDEFTRTVANASLSYNLQPFGRKLSHTFHFFDLSYVYLPWISDAFRDQFLQPSNLLRYSYEDHFILDWSYGGRWSNYRKRYPYRSYGTFSYQIETAGNLLYGFSHLFKQQPDTDGAYKIFNIRYSQYVKGDFDFTAHHIFSPKHRMVYHGSIGIAVPYGNASSIPFEKRYFAGGANSVRGWTARTLGPGGYRGADGTIAYNNQVGDLKLDLNIEYRWRVWSILELAAFTDAGNVWTIRDYPTQPWGVFKFDEFYKQIAWSYGIGIRLDFSFFVFRVDFGVKLYDPSRLYIDGTQWRTAPNGLCWKDDMTFHFAIGYPF